MNEAATDRPVGGQPGVGIGVGEEQLYQQGFPQGSILHRFGTAVSVVRDMPGWYVADGTQPALVIDGVDYGSPDLRLRMLVATDDVSVGFLVGDTGGGGTHTHPFTHEAAHAITQPTFAVHNDHDALAHTENHTVGQPTAHGDHTPDNNHSVTQANTHAAHSWNLAEVNNVNVFGGGAGSGIYMAYANGAPAAVAALAHAAHAGAAVSAHSAMSHTNNHSGATVTAHGNHSVSTHSGHVRSVDVALTNNAPHSGGAVDAAAAPYPPFMAVWAILKVF